MQYWHRQHSEALALRQAKDVRPLKEQRDSRAAEDARRSRWVPSVSTTPSKRATLACAAVAEMEALRAVAGWQPQM
jgi:hypothetical protein